MLKLTIETSPARLIGTNIVINLSGAGVEDISPVVNRAPPSYRRLRRLGGCANNQNQLGGIYA